MNSPISNFELGQMTHREYEAAASRSWEQRSLQTSFGKQRFNQFLVVMVVIVAGLLLGA